MILDFPNLPMESFPAFKGGEKELSAQMFFDGVNRILHGVLIPGASIGMHTHETNSEVIFVVAGHGTIIEDGEPHFIHIGQCTYCPKGHTHSLVNTSEEEDLEFYAVVPEQ
ncbi:MAG: cupin domain-containing protein [Bacteroidales bacterium]|nr:cupin domain-containing protein [Candidatus Colicola faecequi]